MAKQEFIAKSIFGHFSQKPLVELDYLEDGKVRHSLQMELDDARALALNILGACEASVTDAFLIKFMRDRVKSSPSQVAGILKEFREFRKAENL